MALSITSPSDIDPPAAFAIQAATDTAIVGAITVLSVGADTAYGIDCETGDRIRVPIDTYIEADRLQPIDTADCAP